MQSMRLLHVIPSYAPAFRHGGPIFAVLGLTRALARLGNRVTVMTTNIDGSGVLDIPLGRPVEIEGVEVWYWPVEHPRWWCFSRHLWGALREAVREFDVVHIHSVFLWPTTAAAYWCRRYGVPYIVSPRGALDPICLEKVYEQGWRRRFSHFKKWSWLHTFGKLDLQYATAVHFTSHAEMEATRILALRAPGFVVPNGVDIPEVTRGTPDNCSLRLLYLGRLDAKKGIENLLKACARLSHRGRVRFVLRIAGSGTSIYAQKLQTMVKALGLEREVQMLGEVTGNAKRALFEATDVLVVPSYVENFAVVVAEALAHGVPVVASKGTPWQRVEDVGCGLWVDNDPESLARAIEEISRMPLREMGERGQAWMKEEFAWPRIARQMETLYQSLAR